MLTPQTLLLTLALLVQNAAPFKEGPALAQVLDSPMSVVADDTGGFYVASGTRVYFVTSSGVMRLVPGTETASFDEPLALALDSAGVLYIADSGNNTVHKVAKNGVMQTIAGTGAAGFDGDGGPAIKASLNQPSSVAVDSKGNVYIADYGNSRIRRITPAGVISTVAGDGKRGFAGEDGKAADARFDGINGLAVDEQDNVYVADIINLRIRKITPEGAISTVIGQASTVFNGPVEIAVDHAGAIYLAETVHHRVIRASPNGVFTLIAGAGGPGFQGDGGPAYAARLDAPRSVSVDKSGDVYIADTENHRVRKIDARGVISTIAGNGTAPPKPAENPASAATRLPAGPIRIGGDMLQANCMKCSPPDYPTKARAQRISDTVVMTVIVDKEGHVREVIVIRGNPILAEAAVKTVQGWQYRPQRLNGEPVEVTSTISISFVFK